MDRRSFLGFASALCSTALPGSTAKADEPTRARNGAAEFNAVLVDTTRCTGCRKCEEVCANAHQLPAPNIEDRRVFEEHRTPSIDQRSVIDRIGSGKEAVYVKRQCMNCNQPACASACLVQAMKKTETGPVIWQGDKCMGCRFCMVSCPFDMPRFEYDEANPRIHKCDLCHDRVAEGDVPACVEACPVEALVFGRRRELLALAHDRIRKNPDRYVPEVYGESEVGGTSWLYLAGVPFDQLGFPTRLGDEPYPELTKGFLSKVPLVLLLWPPLLLGIRRARQAEPASVPSETEVAS